MSAGEFDGLVAVVTGGASGIGLATAETLAARGATVAVLDRNIDGLPDALTGFVADVSDRASVDQAIAAIADRFGGIDIVVNNAGISAVGTVEENDDAEWARVLDINVVGMARVTAAALPWLRRSDAAAVVNLASIAALNGLPQRALYSASKGAVLALTYAMATDHVARGHPRELREPGDRGDAVRRADAAGLRRSRGRTRRARRPAGHRPHGRARRGRGGDRLPREPAVGFDDGNRPRRRRRHDAPAGAPGGGARMKRLASVIGMPAENREEYERLHAAVWPAVLERLTLSNIRNYSIYRHGEVLFAYMEYVGDDFEADMAAIAADPATQEWWSVCEPLQRPFPERAAGRVVDGDPRGVPPGLTCASGIAARRMRHVHAGAGLNRRCAR